MTVAEFAKSKYTYHSEDIGDEHIVMTKVNDEITVGKSNTTTHILTSIEHYKFDFDSESIVIKTACITPNA